MLFTVSSGFRGFFRLSCYAPAIGMGARWTKPWRLISKKSTDEHEPKTDFLEASEANLETLKI